MSCKKGRNTFYTKYFQKYRFTTSKIFKYLYIYFLCASFLLIDNKFKLIVKWDIDPPISIFSDGDLNDFLTCFRNYLLLVWWLLSIDDTTPPKAIMKNKKGSFSNIYCLKNHVKNTGNISMYQNKLFEA